MERASEHRRLGPAWSLHGRDRAHAHRSGHWVALTVAAVAVALLLILSLWAEQARATVLVNAPAGTVACGRPMVLGIWYQSFSGGPRWARVTVRNAAGRIVFHRAANAGASWRYWRYRGVCGARYLVTYVTHGGTVRFHVHVR